MKKRTMKKLNLAKETVRNLEDQQVRVAVGETGAACATAYNCTQTCYCTTAHSHCTA